VHAPELALAAVAGAMSSSVRTSRLAVALVSLWLLAMILMASPRRVGDASEYVAMAMNMAEWKPPALSDEDFTRIGTELVGHAGEFELTTRRLPELRGTDRRQDMPHMWLYALLAAPGVAVTSQIGVSPAWAFVGVNVLLVAGLAWLALLHGARAWALIVFASPLVWWMDKPLADLLVACSLGAAALLWARRRPLALLVLGPAAAQNPALVAVLAIFAVCGMAADPRLLRQRGWWAGLAGGAACASIAPLYYLWHLGRVSPLTTYTVAHWPGWTSALFPLTDLNMGALVRFAPGMLAIGIAVAQRPHWRSSATLPAALAVVGLLAIVSQQPNQNQGGNPDFSRYAVWLLPLALPWLLAADRREQRAWRIGGVVLLAASCAWTAWQFPPTRPESYRYPTPLASWVWTRQPGWTNPRPEAFAERISHREPASIPVATGGCEKVLLVEGRWPGACLPGGRLPAVCAESGRFCYANRDPSGGHAFVDAGTIPLLEFTGHDRWWRHDDTGARWLAPIVGALRPAADDGPVASIRATSSVRWGQTWGDERRLVLYVRDAQVGARVALRTSHTLTMVVRVPGHAAAPPRRLSPTRESPLTLDLPGGRDVVVELEVDGHGG
jgi:hypothetical protein